MITDDALAAGRSTDRLDRVLGRVLRIEAERGASFDQLVAGFPQLGRRLLSQALAASAEASDVGPERPRDLIPACPLEPFATIGADAVAPRPATAGDFRRSLTGIKEARRADDYLSRGVNPEGKEHSDVRQEHPCRL